jgi:hypothetical protein
MWTVEKHSFTYLSQKRRFVYSQYTLKEEIFAYIRQYTYQYIKKSKVGTLDCSTNLRLLSL